MASTLSSWAASMKEQVLTMTTSALAASLVISTPLFTSEPSMISASTRFFAQPREINPTRTGFLSVSVTGRTRYAMEVRLQPLVFQGLAPKWRKDNRYGFSRRKASGG